MKNNKKNTKKQEQEQTSSSADAEKLRSVIQREEKCWQVVGRQLPYRMRRE